MKLSDFQFGFADDLGRVSYSFAAENTKSFLPRPANYSDKKSDIFALDSAIYEIVAGHELFPGLDELEDELEIERRFVEERFPNVDQLLGGAVIEKCWKQLYDDASICVQDIAELQQQSGK